MTQAKITDPNQLVGQFFRHADNLRIYRVESVEKDGVNVVEVHGMHLPAIPPEELTEQVDMITWGALRRFYTLLIQANDIVGDV